MSWWFIYWITRLDAVNEFFAVMGGVSIVCAVIIGIFYAMSKGVQMMDGEDNEYMIAKLLFPWLRNTIISGIVFSILAVLTPNLKEAAAIYLIPKMVNNEAVQEIPNDAAKLLQLKLEEWINDIGGKEDTGGGSDL